MEKITITKELLLAANDYVPLAEKERWAAENAPKCFDRLSITAGEDAMPPMYMVNTGLKSRYLMAALAKLYFGLKYEADLADAALMSASDYDRWAGSHLFNQIERWKSDKDVRDRCFDLLNDYHDLEKRFSAQLHGLLNVQNDFVLRQGQYTAVQMQSIPGLLEQLKGLREGQENGEETTD